MYIVSLPCLYVFYSILLNNDIQITCEHDINAFLKLMHTYLLITQAKGEDTHKIQITYS